MNQKLLAKLRQHTTIADTSVLNDSRFFTDKELISTSIPIINVALSGALDGGFSYGITQWCGESKNFKTLFSLIMAKAYMDKFPDSIMLFYDNEFGSPKQYWDMIGIDTTRVIHTPITTIEELRNDISGQLKELTVKDNIVIVVDSIGNLASNKELRDAEEGKDVTDMTRAKALKSLFRIITPHLSIKEIPMIVVNHTYKELALFPKNIVSGGAGSYYSAGNIYIVGRKQDKSGSGATAKLNGYDFIINVEKSRFVVEKSKIPVQVRFETGVSRWSGLLDLAVEGKFITKIASKPIKYKKLDGDQEYTEAQTNTADFWKPLLENQEFQQFVKDKYQLSSKSIEEK